MEGVSSGGLAALGKEILDWVFSPGGRIALIVIAVTLVMRAFRLRRRGRKPARNSAWLLERLKGAGFEKWVYLDLFMYLGLAGAIGAGSFFALGHFADVLIPTGYDYLFRPDKDWVMLPALFLGIALPGFLWLPIGRAIHGKRIRKYVLYMIARQKADTRPFIKWGCTPIALLAVVFAIQFARAHIGLIRDGAEVMLVQQGVFAIHPKQYALSDISAVYMVMRRRAPNGNVLERPYVAVTFEGSGVWTSEWWIGEPKGSDLTDLAARISHRTGLAVHPRILFGEDEIQKTQVSRP